MFLFNELLDNCSNLLWEKSKVTFLIVSVSGRTSFSTCAECYSDSCNALCTRPDCGLHGGSANVDQDPTRKPKIRSA